MSWRYDLRNLTPQQRAIVMQRDEEEKIRRDEANQKDKAHSDNTNAKFPIFNMKYAGTTAKAQEINGEFVVLKDSLSRKNHTHSLTDTYIHIREELVKDGYLTDSQYPDFWIFTQNVSFHSPTSAAAVVGGALINGRQRWKILNTSQTYAEWAKKK